jgi:hypothetical protein
MRKWWKYMELYGAIWSALEDSGVPCGLKI